MVDISLVNDHPQRTFLLIDQLRGNFAKNAEQTLLSGLVKYQEWLLSMEGPERLDFTSEFQKMLEGSTHSWYNPRSWSSATSTPWRCRGTETDALGIHGSARNPCV